MKKSIFLVCLVVFGVVSLSAIGPIVSGSPVSYTHLNLSVSGGNEKSNYAFSGNYTDQSGIIKNSGYERFAVRANIGSLSLIHIYTR